MRISRTAGAVTAAATALLALLPAASASAATPDVLTYGSLGGSNVAVGDTLTASLLSGTSVAFDTTSAGGTGVTCGTSTFSATVTGNPAAPGVATESLNAQTFGSCKTNVFGTTGVKSVTVQNLPFSVTADDSNDTITVSGSPVKTTLVLNTILGTITCVYTAPSFTGTLSNTDNSLTATKQPFTLLSGSGLCSSTGYFSASYGPVVDSSQAGSPAVFTN